MRICGVCSYPGHFAGLGESGAEVVVCCIAGDSVVCYYTTGLIWRFLANDGILAVGVK